jgi:hypothetical protein
MFKFSTDSELVDGRLIFVEEQGGTVIFSPVASEVMTPAHADAFLRHLTVLELNRRDYRRAHIHNVTVEQMRRSDAIDAETVAMLEKEMTPEALDKSSSKPPLLKPKDFEAEAVGSIHDAGSAWAGVESHMVLGGES